jgi:hypothetical protein
MSAEAPPRPSEELLRSVAGEAAAAGAAAPQLADEPVATALRRAAALLGERKSAVLEAN